MLHLHHLPDCTQGQSALVRWKASYGYGLGLDDVAYANYIYFLEAISIPEWLTSRARYGRSN